MIIVTGAAGFIGSCLVARLNELGHKRDVVVVDDFYKDYKDANLDGKHVREWIHRDIFLHWFEQVPTMIEYGRPPGCSHGYCRAGCCHF